MRSGPSADALLRSTELLQAFVHSLESVLEQLGKCDRRIDRRITKARVGDVVRTMPTRDWPIFNHDHVANARELAGYLGASSLEPPAKRLLTDARRLETTLKAFLITEGKYVNTTPDKAADIRFLDKQQYACDALKKLTDRMRTNAEELLRDVNALARKPPRRTRRRQTERKPRPLTRKQVEAMQVVGECKGDIAKAARQLGVDRKTLQEHYDAALKKLGISAVQHKKRYVKSDRRGQADVTYEDDWRRG